MTKGKTELKDPKTISSIVEREEKDLLESIGWREHLTLSEIGRKAIIEYIKGHAEGNETFKIDKWQVDPDFQAVPTIYAGKDKIRNYYQDCNDSDKLKFRAALNQAVEQINNVEYNNSKVKRMKYV